MLIPATPSLGNKVICRYTIYKIQEALFYVGYIIRDLADTGSGVPGRKKLGSDARFFRREASRNIGFDVY